MRCLLINEFIYVNISFICHFDFIEKKVRFVLVTHEQGEVR